MFAPVARKSIPSLDGIRAVAVLIVLVAHCGPTGLLPGGFGVSIFFFLSGYLITRLFIEEKARSSRVNLGAFYVRRLLRLTPPLFLTLAVAYFGVALGVVPGEIHLPVIASQALYYFNYANLYFQNPDHIAAAGTGVLWSLAVEEHFYLVYPFVFIALTRMKRASARLWLLSGMLAAALGWRLFLSIAFGASSDHLYSATDARIDSILYGCLLAMLASSGVAERIFPADVRSRGLITGGAILLLVACFAIRDPLFRDTLRYSLQGIAFMPLFHYAVTLPGSVVHRPLNCALFVKIGTYSYSIYLIHKVAIETLRAATWFPDGFMPLTAATLALSVAYAALIHRYIERPVASLRRRILTEDGHLPDPPARPADPMAQWAIRAN